MRREENTSEVQSRKENRRAEQKRSGKGREDSAQSYGFYKIQSGFPSLCLVTLVLPSLSPSDAQLYDILSLPIHTPFTEQICVRTCQ